MSGLSFSAPTTGTNLAVVTPPMTSGGLCQCNGSLDSPGSGMQFQSVYVLVKAGSDQTITDAECLNSSYVASVNTTFGSDPINWTLPGSAGLQASTGGGGVNTIKALALVIDPSTMAALSPYPTVQMNFTATSASSCS